MSDQQQPASEFGTTVKHLAEVLTHMGQEASKGLWIFNSKIHPAKREDETEPS